MKFNINEKVRVRLTDFGRDCIAKNDSAMMLPVRVIAADADGWTTWQLWELMREFGPYLHMGVKVPFETEIELLTPNDGIQRPAP